MNDYLIKMENCIIGKDYENAIRIGKEAVEKYPYEAKLHESLAYAAYEDEISSKSNQIFTSIELDQFEAEKNTYSE